MSVVNPTAGLGNATLRWRMEQGELMASLRVRAGLSQDDVARAVGLKDHRSVSAIETGRRNVPPERQNAYAEAFGMDPADLVKQLMRYQNPWAYAVMFGTDAKLKQELESAQAHAESLRVPKTRRRQDNYPANAPRNTSSCFPKRPVL